ncbi:hypothetical protein [Chryseobacterium chendengshani]|uniref:hypothetical protein n=1 Tax=Chryseobacterium sp. LJ756 TaxID=2864113 RepID=UPI001C63F1CB|nr:hypothetical protein [Chryseobacterium sp. LJ756]MBW7675848.1 hypothetical protein [Chryseobacterium sp. LJ756]
MKRILITKIIHAEYLKYAYNFNILRILLILLFFQSFAYAQDSPAQVKKQPASIVVSKGSYIYSTDENFNKQILNNKIVLKNADVSYNSGRQDEILITSLPDNSKPKKQFKDQLQTEVKKKKKEALNTINKKIKEFEKRKKEFFHSQQFTQDASSGQFLAIHQGVKDYITPTYHHNNLSKIVNGYNNFLISSALDYLHSQKYFQYNNKSLDFCFSQVFSVRPPPVLVS